MLSMTLLDLLMYLSSFLGGAQMPDNEINTNNENVKTSCVCQAQYV